MSKEMFRLSLETGTRIIGRCFLPLQTKDRSDEGYDLLFDYRSNFGGLREKIGVGIVLFYQEAEQQWMLGLKKTQFSLSTSLPFYLESQVSGDGFSFKKMDLTMVKPNKHFLKHYKRSVYSKQGVLQVPILLLHQGDLIQNCELEFYPSVIDGVEYLVVRSTHLPLKILK